MGGKNTSPFFFFDGLASLASAHSELINSEI
jgi:hypothetical protein